MARNEMLKGKIIQLMNRKLAEFKELQEVEVEVDGEMTIEMAEKPVADLVQFLTELTKTKIKTAVIISLQADKADLVARHSADEANFDEAITGIDSL